MAHYALIDDNNIVTDVIAGPDENSGSKKWHLQIAALHNKECKRTSYNTRGGIHYDPSTGEPSVDQSKAYRKNYAGIGYTYDQARDAFIPPKLLNSWVLDETSCTWIPPTPMPNDGKEYNWNEETTSWEEVTE